MSSWDLQLQKSFFVTLGMKLIWTIVCFLVPWQLHYGAGEIIGEYNEVDESSMHKSIPDNGYSMGR